MMSRPWAGLTRRLTVTPLVAVAVAIALLLASLVLGLHNEGAGRAEKIRQASVQVQILAGSVAAPLAFDDSNATQEYVTALRADRDIEAAAAYDLRGNLVVGFAQPGGELPRVNRVGEPRFEGRHLIVTARVMQGSTALGSVYLRTATETLGRRLTRYLGIALIVLMASLLIAVLGASYASLSETLRKLEAETEGRQQAEEALRQAQKMEALGQLTGGVAHDFNNLLMVASSGLDLMEKTTDPAKRARLKTGIRQAVDRGAKLTQQLLAFARRSPLNPEVIDPAARIRDMHDLLDRSLREDIVVDLQLPPGLWPIEVDASQLEVAVLNIALNARDAMPDGGPIVIDGENIAGPAGDMVRLSIRDSGAGVPPETVARVFDPFFTTKGVGEGTGLGLSQVYGFARSSGGDVRFESEIGKGTTVSLFIPRSAKPLPVLSPPPAAAVSVVEGNRQILLVEDDDNVADLVGEMLKELGYGVDRVPTADHALDTLSSAKFDLVLSDMMMPGKLNGLDLARAVTQNWPALPVILMTGYSAAAASAAKEGIRLLVKPYRMEHLSAELQSALAA